uniref:C2H2-type domain-containing protein n=1 Tax=Leptobrachium leishanense TaxID=445787 RepID=A0A8C5Q7E9_9ANUR
MNKDKARDPLTQRILDLTLEIIFLLTGEGHMVVKIHEMVTDNSRHKISEGGCGRSQSFNMKPPPHSGIHEQNNEKILELTNKIIHLLTGEVPIRCEDVTVYLSMEEWEYVEQHKELYEDVMMENHRPVITFDKSPRGEFHTPGSFSDFGNETNDLKAYLKAAKGQPESGTYTEQECLASGERPAIYPATECTGDPPDIKEEQSEGGEHTISVINKPVADAQTKNTTPPGVESGSHGDLTNHDMYTCLQLTPTEYPFYIKKESPTYVNRNLTDIDLYKPPEHSQTEWSADNNGEYLKVKTNRMEINHSKSLIESRKPDHRIYHTDLLTPLALSSQMGKVSYSESDLVIHKTIYTEEEPFSVTICGGNSSPKSALNSESVHTEGQSFSCPECEKHFKNRIALKKHQMIHTGRKPFKCDECEKCFTQSSHLVAHKTIHTGDKPFKCTECGKGFAQSSHLSIHKMTHTGEKPFNCLECGKMFISSSYLARHVKIHTGVKPYKCAECEKCFTNTSNLARHKMIHTGEKPFKCTECGKCFSQASDLAKHKRSHTGERPFNCAECGKCFASTSNLASHKRVHTGGKLFYCTECGKCFSHPASFAKHQWVHRV